MNLVTLESVTKAIGDRVLFERLDLRVNVDDRIGLIGANGSGKSTLLRLVAGLEPPDEGRVTIWGGVRLRYLAQDPILHGSGSALAHVFAADRRCQLLEEYRALALRLQEATQDAGAADRLAALAAELDLAGAWTAELSARTLLSRLGLTQPEVPIETLSGGQRKRVALARALLESPDLLLLDEPTNHLDADAVAWLEHYLASKPHGLLLVTHDRYFLDRVVGRIVELDRRSLVAYPGNYSRYLELRSARQERLGAIEQRRRNLLHRELAWLRRAPQARSTKQKARAQRVQELSRLEQDSPDRQIAITLGGRRLGERVLEARGLVKTYGTSVVLDGIDLDLAPGQRLGIIGPNGAGKTTLLDILARRTAADAGTVRWGDSVELGYFDQTSTALEDGERVIDFLEARAPLVVDRDGRRTAVARVLEWFLFEGPQQHARIGSLSGGERRRLYLLWTLMQRPNVLFLDEPTNDLDVPTLNVLEEYLDGFGGTLVVVSHDRYFLDRAVDELVSLEAGAVTARHPGPYAVFQKLREEARAASAPDARTVRRVPAARRKAGGAARPSTARKRRELADLEARVALLETHQRSLLAEIRRVAHDHARLAAVSEELARIEAEVSAAMDQWFELAEQIAGEDFS